MTHDTWLAKADELRAALARLQAAELDEPCAPTIADRQERERLFLARWLRTQFSNEAPEDTATLALFPELR